LGQFRGSLGIVSGSSSSFLFQYELTEYTVNRFELGLNYPKTLPEPMSEQQEIGYNIIYPVYMPPFPCQEK